MRVGKNLVVQGDSFRVRAGVGLLADTSYTRTDIRLSEHKIIELNATYLTFILNLTL